MNIYISNLSYAVNDGDLKIYLGNMEKFPLQR